MNCDRCEALVDDYVDGTLAQDERAAVETHLAGCAACRAMAHDFRSIRSTAGSLERHTPPAQAWREIAAAVERDRSRSWVNPLSYVGAIFRSGAIWRVGPIFRSGFAVAAALMLVVVGGASWVLWTQMPGTEPAHRTATTATPSDPELAQTVEHELKLAEEHYQNAIAGLEKITRSESAALDPQVAAVLQKNLEVIDQAIGESRAALQTQPASDVAQESLFEALRNKVVLLQETVVLINEMRKGNQEGTARIVSGLNQ
jgi:anti-sigma factor RsiW